MPLVAMGEGDHLESKIGDEYKRGCFAEAERDVIKATEVLMVGPIFKEVSGELTYKDNHAEPGADGRDEEQHWEIWRVPEGMEFSRSEKEHGTKGRLVKYRENNPKDSEPNYHS